MFSILFNTITSLLQIRATRPRNLQKASPTSANPSSRQKERKQGGKGEKGQRQGQPHVESVTVSLSIKGSKGAGEGIILRVKKKKEREERVVGMEERGGDGGGDC